MRAVCILSFACCYPRISPHLCWHLLFVFFFFSFSLLPSSFGSPLLARTPWMKWEYAKINTQFVLYYCDTSLCQMHLLNARRVERQHFILLADGCLLIDTYTEGICKRRLCFIVEALLDIYSKRVNFNCTHWAWKFKSLPRFSRLIEK